MSVRWLEEFQLCCISIGLTAYTDHLRRESHGNPASGDGGDNKLVQSRVGYPSGSWVVLCGTEL